MSCIRIRKECFLQLSGQQNWNLSETNLTINLKNSLGCKLKLAYVAGQQQILPSLQKIQSSVTFLNRSKPQTLSIRKIKSRTILNQAVFFLSCPVSGGQNSSLMVKKAHSSTNEGP
uniref:Uncharacterized protein n=1 Tax=Micrurus carvalhoi TaxID=3147026 RepID=A0A2H6NCK2_9SAUR